MAYQTIFSRIPNGTRFQATNGDVLIKRKGDGRTTHCFEEQKIVRLNAITPGIAIVDADRTQFVHFCPTDYVKI